MAKLMVRKLYIITMEQAEGLNYKDGKQDGLQQSYIEPTGGEFYFKYVRTEELYKDGKMLWQKTYNEDNAGKKYVAKEETVDEGITKGYLANGTQSFQIAANGRNFQIGNASVNKLEFIAKDGKKNGLYREWYSNGQLADSCYYKMDVLDGTEKRYNPSGALTMDVYYIDGISLSPIDSTKTTTDPSGHFKMYGKNGLVIVEGTTVDGKLQGEYKIYFDGVRAIKDCFYKDGKLNGSCKTWAINDNFTDRRAYELKSEYNYADGLLDGEAYAKYDNWTYPWHPDPISRPKVVLIQSTACL